MQEGWQRAILALYIMGMMPFVGAVKDCLRPLLPYFHNHYILSPQQGGRLVLAQAIGNVVGCLLVTSMIQRLQIKGSMAFATGILLLGSSLLSIGPHLPLVFTSLFQLGLTSGYFESILCTLAHGSFSEDGFTASFGLATIGEIPLPWIMMLFIHQSWQWHHYFWLLVDGSMIVLAYQWLALPYAQSALTPEAQHMRKRISMVERVNNLVRLPAVRLCAIALFLGDAFSVLLITWLPMYLMNVKYAEPTHVYFHHLAFTIGTALARIIPFISSNLSPCFRAAKPLPSRLLAKLPLSANENRLPLLSAIGISTFLTIVWICSNETLNLLCLFGIGYLWGPTKPFILTKAAAQVDESQRLTLFSMLLASSSVGALAGPYLFSILIDYTSLSLLPLACMLLLLLQGVFFLRMPGRPVEDEEHLPKRMKEKRLESEHGVVCP